ncbi:hypothetical protein BHYA_0118g00070 [Botrytis hyacinthi]|uniref:Uncharacterized protein n=1 Tax=Botrytis hyacinthi TaxID=278943 RepID=A0A4Z1GSR9_9HELO|nr:hypothetical protein BHYA_0118g00070 [Botrytis hyacinthi]
MEVHVADSDSTNSRVFLQRPFMIHPALIHDVQSHMKTHQDPTKIQANFNTPFLGGVVIVEF